MCLQKSFTGADFPQAPHSVTQPHVGLGSWVLASVCLVPEVMDFIDSVGEDFEQLGATRPCQGRKINECVKIPTSFLTELEKAILSSYEGTKGLESPK